MLPELFIRTAWNPERSGYFSPYKPIIIPTWGYEELGVQRFVAPWIPERTELDRAGWTQAQWAVPPARMPNPVLPEQITRPPWNPEKTETDRAGWIQSQWAVPPTQIPEPVLPHSFLRPAWNPERTHEVYWIPQPGVFVGFGYDVYGPMRILGWSRNAGDVFNSAFQQPVVPIPIQFTFEGPGYYARPAWRTVDALHAWPSQIIILPPHSLLVFSPVFFDDDD